MANEYLDKEGKRQLTASSSVLTAFDLKMGMRIHARNLALERAIQAAGIAALKTTILEYADAFYPFLAQEFLQDVEA